MKRQQRETAVIAAIVGASATIIAALIGGIFLLNTTNTQSSSINVVSIVVIIVTIITLALTTPSLIREGIKIRERVKRLKSREKIETPISSSEDDLVAEELKQKLQLESQQLQLELQARELDLEKQRLEIDKQRIDRMNSALEIANKLVDTLYPNFNEAEKATAVRSILSNLLSLGETNGLEPTVLGVEGQEDKEKGEKE